ncbi:flagellar hook-associated protein 1 FlgK [Breoghania corrubedonensis]|uniref:Flagellar hook-associated protein 1 n=1 Tax=Breoghania corrubedonensis TaxID=665038 RepID=A0A2T5VDG0_9HYPH|nr:flagellar hook-associated protein FlgK [Breoghania corrubedonensis]PTW61790.1 flagellar hook-associated protein 1 FlgK [Breoghania corrubedonensis]
MGLSSALNTALYGLDYNQRQLNVAASNIANADTVGYTKKTLQASVDYGNDGRVIGVVADQITRSIDEYAQSQYRSSNADMSYSDLMASYAGRVDKLLGSLEDPGSLSEVMAQFVSDLSSLAASPEDYTARLQVVQSAQALASELNSATSSVQQMRQETETVIGSTVDRINDLISSVDDINDQIVVQKAGGDSTADLEDERDRYLDELSGLIDINVRDNPNGSVRLYTTNGMSLLDVYPSELRFDGRATVSAEAQWNDDPALSKVGTLTLVTPGGSTIDMIATNGVTSGKLGALVDMRDDYLVEVQDQLDEIASQMSLALSNYKVESSDAGATLPQQGLQVDLAALQSGNKVSLTYTDAVSGEEKTISFLRVDDASQLPLDNTETADPNDTVYGIDFSAGNASAATQMQAALAAAGFTVSNTGSVFSFVDDGGTTSTITGLDATVTASGLTGEGAALPFFTDGRSGTAYTDALEGRDQKVGYAGRITVNPDLMADISRLVVYDTVGQTEEGDPTRPLAMLNALTQDSFQFDSRAGVGTKTAPFNGTVVDYLSEVVGRQSSKAANLDLVRAGQEVATNNLKDRVDDSSAVNMDEELARLIQLQNAYNANARVMTVVQELFDVLMRA